MTTIFYYARACVQCSKVLQAISQMGDLYKTILFQCVDRRIVDKGHTYIMLDNNTRVIMPPQVTAVPALINLIDGGTIIYGDAIYGHLQTMLHHWQQQHQPQPALAPKRSDEINTSDAFAFDSWNAGSAIKSEQYSTLDFSETAHTQPHSATGPTPTPPSMQYTAPVQVHVPQDDSIPSMQPPQKIEKDLGRVTDNEYSQYLATRELGMPKQINRI